MSRLTRDGSAEPVSRDQILRHARGQGNIHFPCSADHEQDWQPYPVGPYSAMCDDHTYIHIRTRHVIYGVRRSSRKCLCPFWLPLRTPLILYKIIDPVGVNESTTVSSAWELTSVSMHYSQGNGVHTPLSRTCTVPTFSK